LSNFISDEDVQRMHYRQAAQLIQVPAQDRGVVLMHAHFLMNASPGTNLSGGLWMARQAYNRIGADGLRAETAERNAARMAADTRAALYR
jgi:phage major head subunit gpT-like protein